MRVNRACICGSDLHLSHGLVPDARIGTTFGHEFTGVIEEVGPSVQTLKMGDPVLVLSMYFAVPSIFSSKLFTAIAMKSMPNLAWRAPFTAARTRLADTPEARPNMCGCP